MKQTRRTFLTGASALSAATLYWDRQLSLRLSSQRRRNRWIQSHCLPVFLRWSWMGMIPFCPMTNRPMIDTRKYARLCSACMTICKVARRVRGIDYCRYPRPIRRILADDSFALPEELSGIKGLFDDGNAAIVGNVGPLIQPITKTQFENDSAPQPKRLFSHNDQQSTWMSSEPEGAQFGWGGRFADAALSCWRKLRRAGLFDNYQSWKRALFDRIRSEPISNWPARGAGN